MCHNCQIHTCMYILCAYVWAPIFHYQILHACRWLRWLIPWFLFLLGCIAGGPGLLPFISSHRFSPNLIVVATTALQFTDPFGWEQPHGETYTEAVSHGGNPEAHKPQVVAGSFAQIITGPDAPNSLSTPLKISFRVLISGKVLAPRHKPIGSGMGPGQSGWKMLQIWDSYRGWMIF